VVNSGKYSVLIKGFDSPNIEYICKDIPVFRGMRKCVL